MTDDQKRPFLRARAGRLFAALASLGVLLAAAPALAQEFEKVDEAARENLPATPFVAAAYGFIWIAIAAYVIVTARRVRLVEKDLGNLRRRLDAGAAGGAAPR